MKTYWGFFFEGKTISESDGPIVGVCSSAIVPELDLELARIRLRESLQKEGIELVKIDESIEICPSKIDADDPENADWVEWYFKAKSVGEVCFDPWQTFKLED